jgi:hypothetical protein
MNTKKLLEAAKEARKRVSQYPQEKRDDLAKRGLSTIKNSPRKP